MSRAKKRAQAKAVRPIFRAAPAPVEVSPEELERAQRAIVAERIFGLCRARIIERYPTIWPGEVIGATIAEQWMRIVHARFMQAAAEQAGAQSTRERAAAAGIALPS